MVSRNKSLNGKIDGIKTLEILQNEPRKPKEKQADEVLRFI